MKKIKLIYNPHAGKKKFKGELDECLRRFQQAGVEVSLFRTTAKGDIDAHLSAINPDAFDAIAISGGDGSVNMTVNAMMKYGLSHMRLGIIPSGTANDLARFLNIPPEPDGYLDVLLEDHVRKMDVGLVNGRYFVNVLAGGLLSEISRNVDETLKDLLGKTAYYLKGMEIIPNIRPLPVRVTNGKRVFDEDIYVFIVLNSSGTGGLHNLSPNASVSDGLLDFIGIKACSILEIPRILMKWANNGEHLVDERVVFFRDRHIKIELLGDERNVPETDVDGEQGPAFPLEIKAVKHAVSVLAKE